MGKINNFETANQPQVMGDHLKEGENRRIKGNRLEVLFPVFVSNLKGDLIQGYNEAINLSWSGMMFESNIPYQVKDEIKLEFALPDSDYTIETRGRVVHRKEIDDDAAIVGVVFTEMDPNLRRLLTGYVLERLEA